MLTKMNSMELKLTNSQTEQMLAKLSCIELKLIKSRVAQMLARLNSMELKLNTMVLREPQCWLSELNGAKIEHKGVERAKMLAE